MEGIVSFSKSFIPLNAYSPIIVIPESRVTVLTLSAGTLLILEIVKDVAELSEVKEKTLLNLLDEANLCISDAIYESLAKGEDVTELDIGIGTLYILVEGADLRYKFFPNNSLQTIVKTTIKTKSNQLTKTADSSLIAKVSKTYKELF